MLKNVMEDLVDRRLTELLKKTNYEGCSCARCLEDITAYALNHLPPRYVSTESGGVIARTLEMDTDSEFTVLRVLAEAMKRVEDSPHH